MEAEVKRVTTVFFSCGMLLDEFFQVGVEERCWCVDKEGDTVLIFEWVVFLSGKEGGKVSGEDGYWFRRGEGNSSFAPRLLLFKLVKAEMFTNPVELFRLGSLGKVNPGAPKGTPCVEPWLGGNVGARGLEAAGPKWKGKWSKSPW